MPDGLPAQSDPSLLAKLHDVAGIVAGRLAAAVVDLRAEPRTRLAVVRSSADTVFEIGSITKALTGMLLADTVQEGRLPLDTCVGAIAPETEGSDLASVTLLELATHTSGLPRMPAGGAGALRMVPYALAGRNPYGGSPMSVIDVAARQQLHGRGQRRYSNLGGALLGELLGIALSTDYPSLLVRRVLRPLGMEATGISTSDNCAPWGRSSLGLPREPWALRGYAPAGGVFSTIEDMADWRRASWMDLPQDRRPSVRSTVSLPIVRIDGRGCAGSSMDRQIGSPPLPGITGGLAGTRRSWP